MEAMKMKTLRALILGSLLATGLLTGTAMAGPVNINTADAVTLAKELAGVGEKTAAAIVAYREANGPFATVEDLKKVKGIGDAIIEKNRTNILLSE
ncbi:MAG TPA: helix-hairpin-helix domain-containing protein [Gammaproteobacteria bacterium]